MDIVKFLLEDLPNESSKNRKIELLKEHETHTLKEVLKFVYNPLIVTGISKAKLSKIVSVQPTRTFKRVIDLMEYLKENNTGTDEVIANVQQFIAESDSENERVLIEKIVTKDLQTGMTSATLNKAYGKDFIPKFDVQKAESYFKQTKPLQEDFFITEKLDGIRAVAFKYSNDNIVFYARSGKEITGLNEIADALKAMPDGYVYDGELLAFNPDNLDSKDLFAVTSSIVNSKGIKSDLAYNLFDMVPIKEFNAGVSREQAYIRVTNLHIFVKAAANKHLSFPPILYLGNDENAVSGLLDLVTEQGKEGLMISKCNGHYRTKRTKDLLKVKKMNTVDLRCKRVEEHKQGNKLGAIVVDYKGFEVNVGSGFNDEQREMFWQDQKSIVGKIIEVQYFEETTNKKDDSLSLRFPVFKMVRNDKDEVSYH